MNELDPFEQGMHTFSGVVKTWTPTTGEVITDSGLVLFLDTHNQPPLPPGTRITIAARKYRTCYKVLRVGGA